MEIWDGFLKSAGKISKNLFFFFKSFFLAPESYSGAWSGPAACSSTRTHRSPWRLFDAHPKRRAKRLHAHPSFSKPNPRGILGWDAMSPCGIRRGPRLLPPQDKMKSGFWWPIPCLLQVTATSVLQRKCRL